MTVIRPNSVSGITSITAQANEINFFRSNGTLAGLQLNGVNFNTTTGISTFNNLDVGGVLTYQDVTNVDSIGIITARSTIDAQGDVSIADKIIHTGDTNTAIRFPAADTFTVETAGDEALRIDSSGRLLLNTTTTYVSNQMMIVKGASPSAGGNRPYDGQLAIEGSETTGAINTGGVLAFIGHDGGSSRGFGSIRNLKEDGTSGNYGTYMSFETRTNGSAPTEKLRIDSDGRLLVGHNSARVVSTTVNPYLQLEGTTFHQSAISVTRNTDDAYGSYLILGKSRAAATGGNVILQDNDIISEVRFAGSDGNDMVNVAAQIRVEVDGTPQTDQMPGAMIFYTNAGSASATERLRIMSDGEMKINHTQSSTPLSNTFISIYDANSDSSAIDASGVSKNYAMISLHN